MKERIDVSPELLCFVGTGSIDPNGWPEDPFMLAFEFGGSGSVIAELVEHPGEREESAAAIVMVIARAARERLYPGLKPAGARWYLPSELRSVSQAIESGSAAPASLALRLAKSIELFCGLFDALLAGALIPADAAGVLCEADARRVAKAESMIAARWQEKLTIDMIARECGVSRAKLTRAFRQMFHTSVHEAIASRRLESAHAMLTSGNLPVSSIAHACGYLNNAAFTRAFNRRYKQSPSHMRTLARPSTLSLGEPANAGDTRVDHAIRHVQRHIRACGMRVGDTLPASATFASELGVSRAVMREAFGALAALGQINVSNGRRAKVGAMDGAVMAASLDHAIATSQVSIAEVWDMRRTVELRNVELAALNRTDQEAHQIIAAADAMVAAFDDLDSITRNDIRFHQEIARASRNVLSYQTICSYEPLMRVSVPNAWHTRTTEEQRRAVLSQHREIAQRIFDRDPAGAVAAMDAHFESTIGDLLSGL